MTVISHNGITLYIENRSMEKPISLYSDDVTDFQFRKYIQMGSLYFMQKDQGEMLPVSEEEALAFIESLTPSPSPASTHSQ